MNITKQLTRALGAVGFAALIVGLAGPAAASPVPPVADNALIGTWVNTNSATNSIKQVVIEPLRTGSVSVDGFGSCSPTLCEWGRVPAIVYGSSVSSKTGTIFQTNQAFLTGDTEWSRRTLLGTVTKTTAGLRLSLRALTVFEDGSGRKNYTSVDTFALGKGQKPTTNGSSVTSYRRGDPPSLTSGALGDWVPATPSGGLAKLNVSGSALFPVVHGYGQCSPSPCDWGTSRATTYGAAVGSQVGSTALAPYSFGFKNTQLLLAYSARGKSERLTVWEYNEFTDGSGRSNYAKVETLVRP